MRRPQRLPSSLSLTPKGLLGSLSRYLWLHLFSPPLHWPPWSVCFPPLHGSPAYFRAFALALPSAAMLFLPDTHGFRLWFKITFLRKLSLARVLQHFSTPFFPLFFSLQNLSPAKRIYASFYSFIFFLNLLECNLHQDRNFCLF